MAPEASGARLARIGLLLALAGCASAPPPTPAQQQRLEAAEARFQRCVQTWNPDARGISATATTAMARAIMIACRSEWVALADTAVEALGESGAEDRLAVIEEWVFREARDRALRAGT